MCILFFRCAKITVSLILTSGRSIKKFDIDWGLFGIVEFIISEQREIGKRYKTALDIGSGAGVHTQILRAVGLEVFQLDKYSDKAEYKVDFIEHNLDRKFDIVFCSHVIEHQRNVGSFLDKIFDVMSDDGLLILSAPKHAAETLIGGHLNCFFTSYFIQHLIHAGFDLKNGKFLSCGGIENAAIVSKSDNYELNERNEDGYTWTDRHQKRSFIDLRNCTISNTDNFFNNCRVFATDDGKNIRLINQKDFIPYGLEINSKRHKVDLKL